MKDRNDSGFGRMMHKMALRQVEKFTTGKGRNHVKE
jgi:hypothetical protein